MKKYILFIIAILSLAISANAQDWGHYTTHHPITKSQYYTHKNTRWFPFDSVNSKYSVSAMGGVLIADDIDEIISGAVGINATIKGVSIDAMYFTPKETDFYGINESKSWYDWGTRQGFGFHLGFQIPITQTFRITPFIGMLFFNYKFDEYDWNDYYGERYKTTSSVSREQINGGLKLSLVAKNGCMFSATLSPYVNTIGFGWEF